MTKIDNSEFQLQTGETILNEQLPSKFWTAGLYILTLGAWSVWRKRHRFILTNKRVVVRMGIITKSQVEIPLGRVQDISVVTSVVNGSVIAFSSAGGSLGASSIGPLTRAQAREFAECLRNAVTTTGAGL